MTQKDAPKPDEFDPSSLRLTQDFSAAVGVKKVRVNVPVRRPDAQWFVRVHPEPEWCLPVALIELKDDREVYVVDPKLCADLSREVVPKLLVSAVNGQNDFFFWPIRQPGADGKIDEWNRSARAIAETAKKQWVRIMPNRTLGLYDALAASSKLADPVWPEQSFKELLTIAFRDKFISSLDHPVLKKLRGEVA